MLELMDKTIRKYTDFDEMKADEYRYWQSRPVHERMDAVSELTQAMYAMKGARNTCPGPILRRPLPGRIRSMCCCPLPCLRLEPASPFGLTRRAQFIWRDSAVRRRRLLREP